ncbi:MAG: ubiquinone/menaquinone biosynthesis methyltransferase [Deltaproteobacteria bacterium]|nr:ubiquinone/menaquinone biosynthesis methyltransferase [Deltaproteobacteria bacterium]
MSLPEAGAKRAVVEAMFDRIAPRYDLMNRLMTFGIDRGWRRRAIAALALRPDERVLDLACGSGDLAAAAVEAGGRVVGVDVSAGMLREARARRLGCGLVRADALALPLADASIDAVVSGFALRNFVDLRAALAESARVLRPGGRIALLEVDRPASALLRYGHAIYFRRIVPILGALVAERDAYAYLPESTAYLPDEPTLRGLLAAAGFGAIAKRSLLGGAAQLVTAERTDDAAERAGRPAERSPHA